MFAWFDRDRRYFVVTIISLEEGQAVLRKIWHQVVAYMNSDIDMMDLDIPQPEAAEMYYATYSAVDHHNRIRCGDIKF